MDFGHGRYVRSLPADDLEELMKRWVSRQLGRYPASQHSSGAGDRGLDVVGFMTLDRFEGPWDNYQCKQLARTLGENEIFSEVGKVLYYSFLGEFSPPNAYVFVAPTGASRPTKTWLNNPGRFKKEMIENWAVRCAARIRSNGTVPLTDELRAFIEAYEFRRIVCWNVSELLDQPDFRAVLIETCDIDPGRAPQGTVPDVVEDYELPYTCQLRRLYEHTEGRTFANENDMSAHVSHGPHFRQQRLRFHHARSFRLHFRDNAPKALMEQFNAEMRSGVFDAYHATSGLDRVTKVMMQAATLQMNNPFVKHNRAPIEVRQGTCHHFANDGEMPWHP